MDVRRDQQFVRLAENNVRVLGEQVRAAKDRFEVGEVTRTDVSQAEARLAAAVSNLERNKALLRISEQTYKAVVGNMPKNLQDPPTPPQIPATPLAAENLAVSRHPRILEAQFDVQAAEIAVERAKLNRQPTVTGALSAGRGFNTSSEDAELTASITGSVPLYKGGRLNSDRRAALAALERGKAVVQLQALITRQAVNSAYANWQASRAAIESGREQVRAAQIAFDGVSEEARLGARTTLDVLDAEQDLLDARSALISALRDEQVAAYTVLSEMGLMTAGHLNLGVDAYDPDVNYTAVNGRKSPQAERFKVLDKLQKR
jgi:outer membrane protein